MKIFIDVDNTILEHTTFYNSKTEGRLHKIFNYDPISNETAIMRMYESSVCSDVKNLQKLFEQDNVYILTKTSNNIYEKYKRERLAKLFEIEVEELISIKDSSGRMKYVTVDDKTTKSDFIMHFFEMNSIENCILIDDYSQNLIEWEEAGGIGIKFHNEYNSCFHPTGGIVVSNFKLFTYLNDKASIKSFVVDSKLAHYIEKEFRDANYINMLKIIEKDICDRFDLTQIIYENTKNSITDFLKQYYEFMEKYRIDVIKDRIHSNYETGNINVIINPFDFSREFIKIIEETDIITMGFSKNEDEYRLRDVFISTPTEMYADITYNAIVKSMNIIKELAK